MTDQDEEVQEVTTVSESATPQVVRQTRVLKPVINNGSAQNNYDSKKVIFRTYQIIWYVLGVIEVLLGFRILLKLMGANTYSGFVQFIYSVSDPFALPFSGILRTQAASGSVLEWSTFIAMAVYAIIAYGLVALFQLVKPTNPTEVSNTVDNP